MNDYYYNTNGSLNYIVQQDGDDRFYQSGADGYYGQIAQSDLTESTAGSYGAASQLLQSGVIQFDGGGIF